MQFLVVYIAEAHALDSPWPMYGGSAPLVEEPTTDAERVALAGRCVVAMSIQDIPAVVDHVDDKVGKRWNAWPDRLFLVGRDGKVAWAGGRGPRGFRPGELEKAMQAELAKTAGGKDDGRGGG